MGSMIATEQSRLNMTRSKDRNEKNYHRAFEWLMLYSVNSVIYNHNRLFVVFVYPIYPSIPTDVQILQRRASRLRPQLTFCFYVDSITLRAYIDNNI